VSTWVAIIAETGGRSDFWTVAARHGIRATTSAVAPHVLIDCGTAFAKVRSLAQALSLDLDGPCLGFVAQTSADEHCLWAFRRGVALRELEYSRDGGGWQTWRGDVQPWEPAYFFGGGGSFSDGEDWPEMLFDELSDEDMRRYGQAKLAGDATAIRDLLHLSSTVALARVCSSFGIAADAPAATWKPKGLLARLLR